MRRAVRWGMLVVALVTTAPAWADEDHAAVSAREAQARFEEGLVRAKSGDFEAARLSFAQAYAVAHKPAILWNLALTEEKTHRPLEALAHFREWLHQAPPSDPDRARARKHVDELSAAAGHIEVVAAAGAAITVDSIQSAGVAPRVDPIDVAPGRHVIEAKLGAEAKTVAVDVAAGQTAHADFRTTDALVPSVPGATDPQAGLQPGGPITPPPTPDQPAPGHPSTTRIVTVAAIGGVALVSAGVGLGLGIASNHEATTASGLRGQITSCTSNPPAGSPCQKLASTVSAQHTNHVASTGFWVASAVLAATGIGVWFLWPKASVEAGPAAAFQVVPGIGAGSAGVVAVGSF